MKSLMVALLWLMLTAGAFGKNPNEIPLHSRGGLNISLKFVEWKTLHEPNNSAIQGRFSEKNGGVQTHFFNYRLEEVPSSRVNDDLDMETPIVFGPALLLEEKGRGGSLKRDAEIGTWIGPDLTGHSEENFRDHLLWAIYALTIELHSAEKPVKTVVLGTFLTPHVKVKTSGEE